VTDCMAEPAPLRVQMQTLGLKLMKLIGKIKYFHFYHRSDIKNLLESSGFLVKKEADFHDTPVNFYLSGVKKG